MDKKLKDFIDDASSKFKGKIKDDDSNCLRLGGHIDAHYDNIKKDNYIDGPLVGYILPDANVDLAARKARIDKMLKKIHDNKNDINKTPKTEEDEQS